MSFPGRSSRFDAYLPPGTELNATYRIDSPLSSGGMGEIYRGHEIQSGDPVAIKFIRGDMADDEAALALFRKEQSALSRLHHEAIVRYLVFSVDPVLRRHYLAMEFVDGESLSDVLKSGPLGLNEALALLRRIASGLQAAHDRDVVHRDVSPDNVIVKNRDMARARIIDFGIAKSTRVGDSTVIGGGFAGKENYVSPEQLGLFGGEVTGKSDIYSLGLVIAQCLRGRAVDMGGNHFEMIQKRQRIPDLSDIDGRIRPLLEWMLQPDPLARPAHMGDVAVWTFAEPSSGKTIIAPRTSSEPPVASRAGRAVAGAAQKTAPPATKKMAPPVAPAPRALSPRRPFAAPLLLAALVAILGAGGFVAWLQFFSPPAKEAPPPQASLGEPPAALPSSSASSAAPPDARPALLPKADVPARPATGTADNSGTAGGQPPPQPSSQSAGASAQTPSQGLPQVALAPASPSIVRPPAQVFDSAGMVRFVQDFQGGDCFFSRPLQVSARSAHIEGVGTDKAAFVRMFEAFKNSFGFEPDIDFNQVAPAQCPALAFARSLQFDASNAPGITLENADVKNGTEFFPTFHTTSPYAEILLIDERGHVAARSAQISPSEQGVKFRLLLRRSAKDAFPLSYLLMMVASGQPISAPPSERTVTAKEFFERFKTAIASLPTPPTAAVKSFDLTQ